MTRPAIPPGEKFLMYTVAQGPGECWIWMGYRNKAGYGEFKVAGKSYMPHRWAYEIQTGDILGRRHAHHICGNPKCVNPDHIRPMTGTDHVNIHVAKTRRELTHCHRGHAFDEANTRRWRGRRICRSCTNLRAKEYRAQ